jgi:hypothetical protein
MMTKRRDITRGITAAAATTQGVTFTLTREGARHTVYDLGGIKIPIARHSEIGDRMAEVIYKEAAAKLGKDWWKK